MSSPDPVPLNREAFLDFFRRACKPRSEWQVGIEMEKMGRTRPAGEPLPYDGATASVRGVLESLLERLGGAPVYEGEHLIGLNGSWGAVTLEPGGQVEWSSRPARQLARLGTDLDTYLRGLRETGDALGVSWLDVGVDPEHPVERMNWMPKARYKIMRPYMGARGRLSHRMMTQTASIQCAFDFESLADWSSKFRAGVLMAPVAVALFANSARVDGSESGYRSFRQAIWRETAPERCGIPDVVFRPDFGADVWVDWICRVPSMFRYRCRGLVPSGGVPFAELLALEGCEALQPGDWELHLSSVFTEVRSYGYIEVRSADLQPDPRILDVPAFWTGILYDEESRRRALELGAAWDSPREWRAAMDSAAKNGTDGSAGGRPLAAVARRALDLSADGARNGAECVGDPEPVLARLAGLARRHGL